MVPQPTCSPARQCWLRAWNRARTEKLIPFRNTDGSWSCKTYTITVTGAGWNDLSCNCAAGSNGRICKHVAVVAKAIAAGVRPIRPVVAAPAPIELAAVRAARVASDRDPLWEAFN